MATHVILKPPMYAGPIRYQPSPAKFPLDPYQQRVADWRSGEAICAAPAGSGKTHVLIERITGILRESGAIPETILTLAFNKEAAVTLRKRVEARLQKQDAMRVPIYTFHAWALGVLRQWFPVDPRWGNILGGGGDAQGRGGPSRASVWFKAFSRAKYEPQEKWDTWPNLYDMCRDAGLPGDDETAALEWLMRRFPGWDSTEVERTAKVFGAYEQEKRKIPAIDFCDMTALVVAGIEHWEKHGRPGEGTDMHPVAALQMGYVHIQADEMQDANAARWRILLHLGARAKSVVSVGDVRQSIYKFTGAIPEAVFRRLEAGAELLPLRVNRRSTRRVVAFGNAICQGYAWHLGGDALPRDEAQEGKAVRLLEITATDPRTMKRNERDEKCAEWKEDEARAEAAEPLAVVGSILERRLSLKAGRGPRYAILARTNAALVPFEIRLCLEDVPCFVMGKRASVWETDQGQEILGFLHGAAGLAHDSVWHAARRVSRYLPKEAWSSAMRAARARSAPSGVEVGTWLVPAGGSETPASGELIEILRREAAKPRAQPLAKVAEAFAEIARAPTWAERCRAVVARLLEDEKKLAPRRGKKVSGAVDFVQGVDDRAELYRKLGDAAMALGSLQRIEDAMAKSIAAAKSGNAVVLSTVHRAKGQEWPVVFVTQIRDGVFPHIKSEDPEEERRLFYVASTRAMDELVLSAGGDPSEFFRLARGWASESDRTAFPIATAHDALNADP